MKNIHWKACSIIKTLTWHEHYFLILATTVYLGNVSGNSIVLYKISGDSEINHCWHIAGFPPKFLATFHDFPQLFGNQVPWLFLTLTRSELQGPNIFPKSKFNKFQGENLHYFKVLLMTYIYHDKATFTFAVCFSTPTYDARWMCFNFTHSWMNIVGSIDLNKSLQTFSIIAWKLRTVKGILVLNTTPGKKNVVHLHTEH